MAVGLILDKCDWNACKLMLIFSGKHSLFNEVTSQFGGFSLPFQFIGSLLHVHVWWHWQTLVQVPVQAQRSESWGNINTFRKLRAKPRESENRTTLIWLRCLGCRLGVYMVYIGCIWGVHRVYTGVEKGWEKSFNLNLCESWLLSDAINQTRICEG